MSNIEFESSYWITRGDDGEPRVMVKDSALEGKDVDIASIDPESGTLFVLLKPRSDG